METEEWTHKFHFLKWFKKSTLKIRTDFIEKPLTLQGDLPSGLRLFCLPSVSGGEEAGFGGMEITV